MKILSYLTPAGAPTAAAIAEVADAVVVGSALVGRMGELADDPGRMLREVGELVAAMRQAMSEAVGQSPDEP